MSIKEKPVCFIPNEDICPSCKGMRNQFDGVFTTCQSCKSHEGKQKKVPKECYEEFGQDLDGCSTQENEGCGRCSLYK